MLDELTEWWEDLRDRGTGSRVVLVPVPRRWGRSRVLEEFRGVVEDLDGPLAFSISGTPLAGRAVQAQELREALTREHASRSHHEAQQTPSDARNHASRQACPPRLKHAPVRPPPQDLRLLTLGKPMEFGHKAQVIGTFDSTLRRGTGVDVRQSINIDIINIDIRELKY